MKMIPNKFLLCPNCLGVFELVPVNEISNLCKRCKWKKPQKRLCKRGINQYTKLKKCNQWTYTNAGKRKRG